MSISSSGRRNGVNIHSSSSMGPSYNTQTRSENFEYIDTNDMINQLDIAEGIKDILVIRGFNLELLLNTRPHKLAERLGIDEYVAKIIIGSVYDIHKNYLHKSSNRE